MNITRAVWLGCGAALLAAWLAAATTTRTTTQPAPRVTPAPEVAPDPIVAELRQQVDRLRQRKLTVDASPRAVRNPFELGRRAVAGPPDLDRAPAPVDAAPDLPLPASAPPFPYGLAGVAENHGPDGPIRTAIISGPQAVLLLRAGDTFAGRYRIVSVEMTGVEIEEIGTGTVRTLRMP